MAFDRTCVRLFTRSSMEDLFRESGHRVISTTGVNSLADTVYGIGPERWKGWLRKAASPVIGTSRYLPFAVVATPCEGRGRKRPR